MIDRVYPIFSFNRYKILFVTLKGWGKTKGIFIKVQFWDTPDRHGIKVQPSHHL